MTLVDVRSIWVRNMVKQVELFIRQIRERPANDNLDKAVHHLREAMRALLQEMGGTAA